MKNFNYVPILGSFIKTINQDSKKLGFQQAVKNVLIKSQSKFIVTGQTQEVLKVLKDKPCVLVSNHPTNASVLSLIATLQARNDIYLIINRRFIGYAPFLDTHLIPVYIDHHVRENNNNAIIRFITKPFISKETFTHDQEHKKNIESIQKASEIVTKGGLVILFPGFPETRDAGWFPGIGHLLKQIKRKDIYIQMVYIQEAPYIEYLRVLPFVGKFLPKMIFHFEKPITLNAVFEDNPRKLTQQLEKIYKAFKAHFIMR
jgi:hypothetical protein